MIPVLYDSDYTNVDGLTNGLGTLHDTVSCVVTEERNGAYTLTMKYPVSGQHYDDIGISKLIKVIPFDGGNYQFFRIYKISKPLNGIVTIYAQHISYQLSNIPVAPFTASTVTATLAALSTYSVEDNPFNFWTDKTTTATYTQTIPESIRARLGGQSGSILSVYGGEYEWDNYTVKLHASRGSDNGVTLRYGKNITDIKQEENIESTYTGVYPYYYTEDEGLLELTEKVLYADTADNYPFKRTKTIDFTDKFEEMPTEDELRTIAQAYIDDNDIGYPTINIDVSFVALWQTEEYAGIAPLERVNLCDTVTVEFEKLGISESAKVVKTEYDVLLERYNKIEIGSSKTNLATTISDINTETTNKISTTKSRLEAAITHATELIRGGLGGYVVINTDANGYPNELLIMDDDDIDSATKVWRWNLNGLGYSSTGYSGDYGIAITQDGSIVADFITTGALDAGIVSTGLLTDAEDLNSWNLDTGEFSLSSSATLDGDTVETVKSSITANSDAITAEVTRATEAEETLQSSITVNAEAITAEATRATGVEETLSSAITVNADAITAEATRATEAEETLSSSITATAEAITAEVTRATTAEETLSSTITQNADAITAEVTRATEAEETLQSSITVNADAITAEVTRATEAEEALSSSITQTAESISLSVTNGESSSSIQLSLGSTVLSSETIEMTGMVTFTDLSTSGSTTITGDNITTGTIDASVVTVTNIDADNITSGTISADKIKGGQLTISPTYSTDSAIVVKYSTGTSNYLEISPYDGIIVTPPYASSSGITIKSSYNSLKLDGNGLRIGWSSNYSTIELSASSSSNGQLVIGGSGSTSKVTITQNSLTVTKGTCTITGSSDLLKITADYASYTALSVTKGITELQITTITGDYSNTALTVTGVSSSGTTLEVTQGFAELPSLSGAIYATSSKLGFFGASSYNAASKQTVSKLSTSADLSTVITKVNALLTALSSYKLIST